MTVGIRGVRMVLPVGLCCSRVAAAAAAHPRRFLLLQAAPQAQSGRLRPALPSPRPAPPPSPLRPASLPPARLYSSDSEGGEGRRKRSAVVVGVVNPLIWLRNRLYFFLIRAYFDQEFSMSEFTQGAKQAFAIVSRLISERKYDLLEELISQETLQMLKDKLSLLSEDHRSALAADMEEIMYATVGDVGIYYNDSGTNSISKHSYKWERCCLLLSQTIDLSRNAQNSLEVNNTRFLSIPGKEEEIAKNCETGKWTDLRKDYPEKGRKFVSILMRFWYLTSVDLPDKTPDGTKVFTVDFDDETTKETLRLLTANYEFRREFTQGIKSEWTITRIEHPKLLE